MVTCQFVINGQWLKEHIFFLECFHYLGKPPRKSEMCPTAVIFKFTHNQVWPSDSIELAYSILVTVVQVQFYPKSYLSDRAYFHRNDKA